MKHEHRRKRRGAKGIGNIIIIKRVIENFPNLKKEMPIQVQEAFRTPNKQDQNRTCPSYS
jgi:hypothetical protein